VTDADARGRFATTRWTMVATAGRSSDAEAAGALEDLCRTYWSPLYGYLRGRGYGAEEAQDLTQGFFAGLLERQALRLADQTRGRFRAFLLTALKRYVINQHEREAASRRGGHYVRFPLDFDEAERTYAMEHRNDDTPERVFDRKWAAIVLDRTLIRLRQECAAGGRGPAAHVLLPYLTDTGDLPTYREAAESLELSEGAVKVAVHRLRQRFGAILRLEVGETVLDPESVDDEMRELLRAVST
jgi:RNA polymerase sigma factor (sigma-70 family)